MTLVHASPDWNLVTVCLTIIVIASLYAFLVYKGKI